MDQMGSETRKGQINGTDRKYFKYFIMCLSFSALVLSFAAAHFIIIGSFVYDCNSGAGDFWSSNRYQLNSIRLAQYSRTINLSLN
jgi:hypothetical protein